MERASRRLVLIGLAAALLWACKPEELPHVQEEDAFPSNSLDFRIIADGREYRPADTTKTGCLVFVPGGTDLKGLVAKFNDTGRTLSVNGVPQESGVTANNFSSFRNGVNYRIEEAKRLMKENPDMKLQDVAEKCGFSSPTVFGRTFRRETGMTPKEWS